MLKIVLLCISFFIAGPAFAAPKNILIVGDSLSAGYGIEREQSWVALLQKRLGEGYAVQNISVSGNTTSNGLASLPQALKQYKPIVTIIELGGNDGLRGIPLKTIETQLTQLIELAQKADSKVILIGVRLPPNYGPDYTQKFLELYKTLGKKHKVKTIPLFLKGIDDNPKLLQADGIHPTADAQSKMLDNLWEVLKPFIHQ